MIFNGDSNQQDIVSLANRYGKTNTNRYPLIEKAQDATTAERIIWTWIWEAYGGWIFSDDNDTTLPEATRDLPSLTSFIALPDGTQSLKGVEWKDNGENWNQLKPITLEQIKDMGYAEQQFQNTPGNPIWYRPIANGFIMYPQADTARTAALRTQVSLDIVPFVPSDTIKQPGFNSIFHDAVPTYMAMVYARINNPTLALQLQVLWDGNEDSVGASLGGFKKSVKLHYASKYAQMFPPAIKHRKNTISQYVS